MSVEALSLLDGGVLVDVDMGRAPADLVSRGGTLVRVQTGELLPDMDIAIVAGRIAYVGPDASHAIGTGTKILEANGRYMVPGLLDGHMHVESGMLTVSGFVRAVVPHGTTGMFIDPHEIANVFGLRGVRMMVDEAAVQPIHVFVQMPSCVPSAPGLETPGAIIGPAEVAEAMTWPGIVGLGEVMNFPGVFNSDDKMHAEMAVTRQSGKVIGGHYASPDLGRPFHGYAAGGPQDDHEGTRVEDAVARARQGMRVMMRYGSAWHDVAEQCKAVTELGMDSRMFMLCTDDCHSETLVNEGHMDRVVRHAIEQGLTPMQALQMATINTAEHFGVTRDMGMIAPGRHSDILLVSDLGNFKPDVVVARGVVAAENGRLLLEPPSVRRPDFAMHSVHLPRQLTPADFAVRAPAGRKAVAHVIGVIENQAPTRHLRIPVETNDGLVSADLQQDLAKVALVERHRNTGAMQVGLVHGFGFTTRCAVASTVSHDCHNLMIVGTDDACMAQAANLLVGMGGGQVVVCDGKVVGKVELPIAGLLSVQPAEVVAKEAATVLEGFRLCGCNLNNPNMQLSLLGLVVIPELRISDMGLVDVDQFDLIPFFE